MNDTNSAATLHVFEKAGLGKAPFKFIGSRVSKHQDAPGSPVRAGSTCEFCGMSIMNVFDLQGACGSRFHVGSECVLKTGDAGLRKVVAAAKRAHDRKLREARDAKKTAELVTLIADHASDLAALPHPLDWRADKGDTFGDYAAWMMDHCGASGRGRLLKEVKAVLA